MNSRNYGPILVPQSVDFRKLALYRSVRIINPQPVMNQPLEPEKLKDQAQSRMKEHKLHPWRRDRHSQEVVGVCGVLDLVEFFRRLMGFGKC